MLLLLLLASVIAGAGVRFMYSSGVDECAITQSAFLQG
jgi:hypothetical protein